MNAAQALAKLCHGNLDNQRAVADMGAISVVQLLHFDTSALRAKAEVQGGCHARA